VSARTSNFIPDSRKLRFVTSSEGMQQFKDFNIEQKRINSSYCYSKTFSDICVSLFWFSFLSDPTGEGKYSVNTDARRRVVYWSTFKSLTLKENPLNHLKIYILIINKYKQSQTASVV
jgi:hypothetical protein